MAKVLWNHRKEKEFHSKRAKAWGNMSCHKITIKFILEYTGRGWMLEQAGWNHSREIYLSFCVAIRPLLLPKSIYILLNQYDLVLNSTYLLHWMYTTMTFSVQYLFDTRKSHCPLAGETLFAMSNFRSSRVASPGRKKIGTYLLILLTSCLGIFGVLIKFFKKVFLSLLVRIGWVILFFGTKGLQSTFAFVHKFG